VEARTRIATRASAGLLALALLLAAALVLPAGKARATTGAPALFFSLKADRSSAQRLDGATVSAPVHVFVARSTSASDASGIDRVDFKIDGIGVRVEELAPFDLAASATTFASGSHRVDAKVRLTSGATSTVTATFTAGAPATTTTSTSTTSTSTTSTTAKPVVTTTTTSTTVPPAPTVTSRVPRFAADSFWYRALPSAVPLHPASAALVADFDRQWQQYYANVGINTTTYTPPVFVASATTPLRVVRVWDCQGKGFLDPALTTQFLAVPIPDAAVPSPGSDAELVISQPSTDSLWELWRARKTTTGWEACWGGKLGGVSTGSGLFPWPFGTTATGISLAGGLITPEELTAGRIDHALAISLVDLKAKVFSWPASRTDGSSTATNAIVEGQRFRLDPSIDVDALPITRTAKIVAKALQTYGMVVRDKSGSVTFYAENTAAEGRTDLYPALFGTPTYKVLAGIPWTRLQALATDYGKG